MHNRSNLGAGELQQQQNPLFSFRPSWGSAVAADDRIVSHPDSISSFVLPHLLFQGILGMEPPDQNDTAQDQLSQTALDD